MCWTARAGLVADVILVIGASILTVKTFKPADGLSFEDFHGPLLIVLALVLGAATYLNERRSWWRCPR